MEYFFEFLIDRGVISGGMFTGAMGGGVALLCLADTTSRRDMEKALAALSRVNIGSNGGGGGGGGGGGSGSGGSGGGVWPFANLSVIDVEINTEGLVCESSIEPCEDW